ncbi:MAG: insulinase family protein, partial [Sphingobacteriaceae bacterium]
FLNTLPHKKLNLPDPAAALPVAKTKIYLVDVPKAAQTEFRVGYGTGIKYTPTGDYYATYLMNYPLGGDFNSRLNMYLRETKGWTYGANSRYNGDRYSGDFLFSSGIRAASTDSALVDLMSSIKNYNKTGPTPAEVAFMKTAIGQRDALRYETGPQKAAFIARILEYDLPADYVTAQTKMLTGATPEELKTTAGKYLNPDKLNILLVGDKAKILPGLQKSGYEIVELNTDGDPVASN